MAISPKITKVIGPWPNGLITRHEGSYDVSEDFVYDIINLDVTDYGVLAQRPGFVRFHDSWTDGWPANFTNYGAFRLLGSHPLVNKGGLRLYLCMLILTGGTWKERIYFTDDPTVGSPTQIHQTDHGVVKPSDSVRFAQSVLYNGKIYFIRGNVATIPPGVNTHNLQMDNGDSTGASIVALTAAQSRFGYYAFVMQDRVFVADNDGSRVNFSKATDPTVWATPDGGFFDVSPLDGQNISEVIALENVFYVFKDDSTWAFTFNTDPSVDGVLRQISKTYGAFDATTRGNEIYVVNRKGIYRFIDGSFVDVAENLRTIVEAPDSWSADVSITVVNNRLIVGSIFSLGAYTSLCMNLNTGAWTKYNPVDGVIGPTSRRSYLVAKAGGKTFMVWGDTPSGVGEVKGSGGGYFSMMRVGGDINDPDNKTRDQDRLGFTWVPRYLMITVPLSLDDPTRWKKLYRWRFDFKQFDFDTEDDPPILSVRDGDPEVVDQSQTLTGYKDFYTNFFSSVVTKQQRFQVMQFGIDKPASLTDVQAGPGIDQQSTFRIRNLVMDYSVRGLIRT